MFQVSLKVWNGKNFYIPDFYLPEYNIWIEIKGQRYIREDNELRRKSVPQPVLLFISNKFKSDLDLYIQQIKTYPKMALSTGAAPVTLA